MNITRAQWFQITSFIFSSIATGTAFLTPIIGSTRLTLIVGGAGFINMLVNGIGAILTGQAQQVLAVQAMPGVSKIVTNDQANTTLAQIASDPANTKIEKGN